MELIRGLSQLRSRHQGCMATIGNFDGVHRGHQIIMKQLAEAGTRLQLPTTLITFEPQPQEFFKEEQAAPRLTSFREKMIFFQKQTIDRVLCIHFDKAFSLMSAEDFIHEVLLHGLGVQHLMVGDDFRFGRQRQGNFAVLQQAAQRDGFKVERQPTFILSDERVSSTRIRNALAAGDLETARLLLGRSYSIHGRVCHGRALGRTINYPTINIDLRRQHSPVNGVFVVRVHGLGKQVLNGIANIGSRPTINHRRYSPLLEVHIFDFEKNVYGQYVEVELLMRIRDEQHFASFSELKTQIDKDVCQARHFFEQAD